MTKEVTGLAKFNQVIKSESTQNYLQTVLSKKKDQFVTSLTSLVGSNVLLQRCEPLSVMYAAIKAAALDLPFEGSLGMAYCIPYGNQAQFQIGAKGLAQLAIRSGQFVKLHVTEVYEGEYAGTDRRTGEVKWNEVENADTKPVIGYYGYFRLTNGYEYELYWVFFFQAEDGIRDSKSFYNGPWKTNFDEMAKKTLLKKLLKDGNAPMSVEMRNAMLYDQAVFDESGNYGYKDNGRNTSAELAEIAEEAVEEIPINVNAETGEIKPENAPLDMQPEEPQKKPRNANK